MESDVNGGGDETVIATHLRKILIFLKACFVRNLTFTENFKYTVKDVYLPTRISWRASYPVAFKKCTVVLLDPTEISYVSIVSHK